MTLSATFDAMLDAQIRKGNGHGILLSVQSGDGRIGYLGGAGQADPWMPFPIASITKLFTATLVLQLVDEGRLRLEDRVQDLIAHVDLAGLHVVKGVDHGPTLTVRHLLHQTSGLADYYARDVAHDLKRCEDRAYDLADVLEMTRALPPQAAPDSGRSHYSDTNFQLLGALIEAVTGQSYARAVQTRICAPLGLRQTGVLRGEDSGLAIYHGTRPLRIPRTLRSMGPDGGIVSTLEDMRVFLRAFMAMELFSAARGAEMRRWNRLFFPFQYGLGLMRVKLPRWMTLFRQTPELIGHSGASGTFAFHAPAPDITLIGTFNQTDAPRRPVAFMFEVLRACAAREVA